MGAGAYVVNVNSLIQHGAIAPQPMMIIRWNKLHFSAIIVLRLHLFILTGIRFGCARSLLGHPLGVMPGSA